MANDTKWVEKEIDLPFTPYPGMDFDGLSPEESRLRISGMSYDVIEQAFKLRLGWLAQDPPKSSDLYPFGWSLVKQQ